MAPLTQFLREEEKQRVDQDFDRQWLAGEALYFAKQIRCQGAIEPAKERVPTQ